MVSTLWSLVMVSSYSRPPGAPVRWSAPQGRERARGNVTRTTRLFSDTAVDVGARASAAGAACALRLVEHVPGTVMVVVRPQLVGPVGAPDSEPDLDLERRQAAGQRARRGEHDVARALIHRGGGVLHRDDLVGPEDRAAKVQVYRRDARQAAVTCDLEVIGGAAGALDMLAGVGSVFAQDDAERARALDHRHRAEHHEPTALNQLDHAAIQKRHHLQSFGAVSAAEVVRLHAGALFVG